MQLRVPERQVDQDEVDHVIRLYFRERQANPDWGDRRDIVWRVVGMLSGGAHPGVICPGIVYKYS
jgi:hypothetical protein